MSSATRSKARFLVGDWVSFPFGVERALAQVIEDRGPLGKDGRHIYRIRREWDQDDENATERSETELEKADAPPATNPVLVETLKMLGRGKRFSRIVPDIRPRKRRKVTFYLTDGLSEDRYFACDPATFNEWWTETSTFLRTLADAFGPLDSSKN